MTRFVSVFCVNVARPNISNRNPRLLVSDLHNASVILSGDPAVIYLGDDQFAQRLQQYVDLAAALRERALP